jgi:hypothetical protein
MRYCCRTFLTSAAGWAGIAVVTLGACGRSTPVSAGAPRAPSTQVSAPNAITPLLTGAPVASPPSAAPVPAADRTVPSITKPTNRNAKNTPTSRLCWAQTEASLLLVNSMMSSDPKGVVTAQLIPTLDSVDVEIAGLQREKVDPLLAPFLERFANDLKAARAVWTAQPLISSQDLVNSFDFENYPAIKDFIAAAKRDPGCIGVP